MIGGYRAAREPWRPWGVRCTSAARMETQEPALRCPWPIPWSSGRGITRTSTCLRRRRPLHRAGADPVRGLEPPLLRPAAQERNLAERHQRPGDGPGRGVVPSTLRDSLFILDAIHARDGGPKPETVITTPRRTRTSSSASSRSAATSSPGASPTSPTPGCGARTPPPTTARSSRSRSTPSAWTAYGPTGATCSAWPAP